MFDIIPKDLILHILNDWLGSIKDFTCLDRGLTNRELRKCILEEPLAKVIYGGEPITISSDKKLIALIKWKEGRRIDVNNICLRKYNALFGDFFPCFGSYFRTLRELELIDCELKIQYIFYANMPHLMKLNLQSCSIIVITQEDIITELPAEMNVKELMLKRIRIIHREPQTPLPSTTAVSLADCTKLYLWISKCCPHIVKLHLDDCYGAHYPNVIPMIQSLPALKNFRYLLAKDLLSEVINSPATATATDVTVPVPHNITSFSFGAYRFDNNFICEHLLRIMFQCSCDGKVPLDSVGLFVGNISDAVQSELLQKIETNWHKLTFLRLASRPYWDITPIVLTSLKACNAVLETLQLRRMKLDDAIVSYFAQSNALLQLHSLSLEGIDITNQQMESICMSLLASRLTLLKLENLSSVLLTSDAYHVIAHSFPNLQTFDVAIECLDATANADTNHLELVKWFDVLFSKQCAFASTLQVMKIEIGPTFGLKLNKEAHFAFANDLFYDHMLQHWCFPFPVLQSFTMKWKVEHVLMSNIIAKRIVNYCPLLHTLMLDLHEVPFMNIQNRLQIIRLLRE